MLWDSQLVCYGNWTKYVFQVSNTKKYVMSELCYERNMLWDMFWDMFWAYAIYVLGYVLKHKFQYISSKHR